MRKGKMCNKVNTEHRFVSHMNMCVIGTHALTLNCVAINFHLFCVCVCVGECGPRNGHAVMRMQFVFCVPMQRVCVRFAIRYSIAMAIKMPHSIDL